MKALSAKFSLLNNFKERFQKKDEEVTLIDEISQSSDSESFALDFKKSSGEDYLQLQMGIYWKILVSTMLFAIFTGLFFGLSTAFSLSLGGLGGLLYLRLLARSIGKLGESSKGVTKFQLLVPIVIFLLSVKSPQIELLPSMLGFFIFKPCLILHFFLKT